MVLMMMMMIRTLTVLCEEFMQREMEGWELDSEVVDAARPHLGIAELEAKGSCLRHNLLVCQRTLHPVRRAQHGRACAVGAIGEQ
jgi:hypothetical protein